jgi:hypothetical protein
MRVDLDPSFMPRPDLPIQLWRTRRRSDAALAAVSLPDLPSMFTGDASRLAATGTLRVTGPMPVGIVYTQFEEPTLNAHVFSLNCKRPELCFSARILTNSN